MEDAIALVAALDGAGTDPDAIDAALAVYEAERAGQVARIQDAARPSLSWWEHFGRSYLNLPPWQFAFHFFSRSLPESKLRQRDPTFVDAVHQAWRATHGAAGDPLRTPVFVAGVPEPDRVVPVAGRTARLACGPLPLYLPPGDDPPGSPRSWGETFPPRPPRPWGVWVSAPDTEADLGLADETVARGLAAGAALVAVGGGTALTRRLVCEAARLGRHSVTMLVEDGPLDASTEDTARTAVLSGRADLIGVRS
jgi:hypothetical protein